MKQMKKLGRMLVCIIVLCAALLTPSRAWDGSEVQRSGEREMTGAMTGQARSMLDGVDFDASLGENIAQVLENAQRAHSDAVKSAAATLARAAVIIILCSCAQGLVEVTGKPPLALNLAGALGLTAAVYGSLSGLTALCTQTMEQLQTFSKAMLPVMMTALTLCGTPTAASISCTATSLALDFCVTLITGLFVPAVSAYVALITVNAAIGNDTLARLAAFVKWITVGSLRLLLTGFMTYLTLSGTVSHGLDAVAVRTTRFALSGAVPVVGSILSSATDTVLTGAVVLKNTLGVAGMLCTAAVCILPFVQVGVSYLVFKVGAAVLSPICPRPLTGLLDGITSSIGLLLGMLGSVCAIVFFELVFAVLVVSGS